MGKQARLTSLYFKYSSSRLKFTRHNVFCWKSSKPINLIPQTEKRYPSFVSDICLIFSFKSSLTWVRDHDCKKNYVTAAKVITKLCKFRDFTKPQVQLEATRTAVLLCDLTHRLVTWAPLPTFYCGFQLKEDSIKLRADLTYLTQLPAYRYWHETDTPLLHS